MATNGTLTRDQLQQLADDLTMGDVWRAVQVSPDDRSQAGMRAFHNAAIRTELVAEDVPFEAFLDLIRQEDFQAVNARDRAGK